MRICEVEDYGLCIFTENMQGTEVRHTIYQKLPGEAIRPKHVKIARIRTVQFCTETGKVAFDASGYCTDPGEISANFPVSKITAEEAIRIGKSGATEISDSIVIDKLKSFFHTTRLSKDVTIKLSPAECYHLIYNMLNQ